MTSLRAVWNAAACWVFLLVLIRVGFFGTVEITLTTTNHTRVTFVTHTNYVLFDHYAYEEERLDGGRSKKSGLTFRPLWINEVEHEEKHRPSTAHREKDRHSD